MSKLGRLFKFLYKEVIRKKNFPNTVNYEITAKCNLKCEHCYRNKSWDVENELSDKEWIKLFKDHKKRGAEAAYLTGGEPTLRMNVVHAAEKIFPYMGLVTNGTIKVPENIQRRIFVSIDGPRNVHDKIRHAKIFDKIMKNIHGDKRVILTPCLSMTNYRYIDELIQITRGSGVEGITFSLYTASYGNDPLLLKGKELNWTINKLREVWKNNRDIVFLTPYIINLFKTKKFYKSCYFMKEKYFMSFWPNGDLKQPCVMGPGISCATCGCIVPVMSYALEHFDIRAWFLFDKFFPERYYP